MHLDEQHDFISTPWADDDGGEDVEVDSSCGEEEQDASDHDGEEKKNY